MFYKECCFSINKIHLIKVIPSTKKALYRKIHRANQIYCIYYYCNSNAYAFIEDPEYQINNTMFNHNVEVIRDNFDIPFDSKF